MTTFDHAAGARTSGTSARWAWTAVGLVLALVAIGTWTGNIVTTQFGDSYATLPVVQRTFHVPVHALTVSVQDGTVIIERGSSSTAVVKTSGTRTTRTPTNHEAVSGGTLNIRSSCGTSPSASDFCRRNYVVQVPSSASVVAAVGTGSVQVADITGSVQATAGTGPVVISHSGGKVQATADTGPITVLDARGPLTLHSRNGDVAVQGAATRVAVTSGTGNVTAFDLTGATVTATVDNGMVALGFQAAPQHVAASTLTGDITVILPPGGTSYELDLSAKTGRVSSAVQSDPTSTRTVRAVSENGSIAVGAGTSPSLPVRPLAPER